MASESAETLTIRVPGTPFPIKFQDWVHDRVYATLEFANADATTLDVFSAGPGQIIPGGGRTLTHVDTNLTRAGTSGLDPGNQMLVYSIQTFIKAMGYTAGTAALTDMRAQPTLALWHDAQDKIFFEFKYNQKRRSAGLLTRYPQGGGIHVVTNTTGQEIASNGIPSPRDAVAFVMPLWLKPNIGFNGYFEPVVALDVDDTFVYDGTSYTAGYFDLQVSLEGLKQVPVT